MVKSPIFSDLQVGQFRLIARKGYLHFATPSGINSVSLYRPTLPARKCSWVRKISMFPKTTVGNAQSAKLQQFPYFRIDCPQVTFEILCDVLSTLSFPRWFHHSLVFFRSSRTSRHFFGKSAKSLGIPIYRFNICIQNSSMTNQQPTLYPPYS